MKIEEMSAHQLLKSFEANIRANATGEAHDVYATDCLRRELSRRLEIEAFVEGVVIDKWVGWPLGRADRLARRGKLPHAILPDGSIRFIKHSVGLLIKIVEAKGE